MIRLVAIFSAFAFVGCEIQPDKKVGYGKTLKSHLDTSCVESVFNDFKTKSSYLLSLQLIESNSKVSSYDLTIDGQKTSENHTTFTRSSFKLAKEFFVQLQKQCSS
tara:strand:+ start:164 stop:481 length:318 start_codon:yes stop_codon:yes gene_type:complete